MEIDTADTVQVSAIHVAANYGYNANRRHCGQLLPRGAGEVQSTDWLLDNAVWYEPLSTKNSLLNRGKHGFGSIRGVDRGT